MLSRGLAFEEDSCANLRELDSRPIPLTMYQVGFFQVGILEESYIQVFNIWCVIWKSRNISSGCTAFLTGTADPQLAISLPIIPSPSQTSHKSGHYPFDF